MYIFLLLLGFYLLIFKLNIIRDTVKWRISLGMTWYIKKSLPNHRKKIPTITIFEILHTLHTFLGMDINIWPTYPENLCPNFFFWKKYGSKIPYLPKVWTYVQTFVVFFLLKASLTKSCQITISKKSVQ